MIVDMFHRWSWGLIAFTLTCFSSCTQSVPTSIQGKFVAAHWMVSGVSVDYKRHIQLAQANGIDAFALNFGGWNLDTYRDVWLQSIADIFAAAKSLDSNFRVSFLPRLFSGNSERQTMNYSPLALFLIWSDLRLDQGKCAWSCYPIWSSSQSLVVPK